MKRIIFLLTVLGLSFAWNNITHGATGASATATVTDGAVTTVDLTSGGSEYTSAPTVFIMDTGGGSDASATATVSDGAVTGVTVTDGGSGYSSSSTVQVIFLPNTDDLGEPPEETPTDPPTDTPDTSSLPDEPTSSPSSVSRFLGISTRGSVTSSKSMFAGFSITGTESKKVALMGKGLTMTETDASINYLKDPSMMILQLTASGWEAIAVVDDLDSVSGDQHIDTVAGKEGITMPIGPKEAAVVLTLDPGNYAFILSGNDTDFGTDVRECLVEVYEIED